MRIWIEVIGSVAGTCTTLCWIPQALKIIREKRTEGLSLATQLAYALGVALWSIYGLMLHEWPIIVPNLVTLVLAGAILRLKYKYP